MKNFLNKLLTMGLFILSSGCLYLSITKPFSTHFINIVFFIIGIFVLLQACGNIDKTNGFGKYQDKSSQNKSEDNTQSNNDEEDKQEP